MKFTYENNIKDLIDSHNQEIQEIQNTHKEKLEQAKKKYSESEKKLLEKLEDITSDQSDILNKLNDKIIRLSSTNNEDGLFIENICNILDELLDKYSMERNFQVIKNLKDKVLYSLDILNKFLEKNQKNDAKTSVDYIKRKLNLNSATLKEFEEARSNLVKHFEGSPRKNDYNYPLTTRY